VTGHERLKVGALDTFPDRPTKRRGGWRRAIVARAFVELRGGCLAARRLVIGRPRHTRETMVVLSH
jgi:hypothetical protein